MQLINEATEEKLTHLEHAEDHPFNAGSAGYKHAKDSLMAVHHALLGDKPSNASISTKYDGSPSIVFGHHPETGKFFVASKSAFNKTPKLNYSPADIEKNHGHAPGLVSKLKAALKHLPKVTPKEGIYQGDVMHSGVKSKSNPEGDVEFDKSGKATFTPNTITYKAPSEHSDKIKKSKFGVAVHTSYHGPSFEQMKATYNTDTSEFGEHPDVHMIHPTKEDHTKATYTEAQKSAFETYMADAEKAHKKLEKGGYDALGAHTDNIKTYINKTVRDGSTPSVEGYKAHLTELGEKSASKLKTPANQEKKRAETKSLVSSVEKNKAHFTSGLELHGSLQQAKNQLAHALSSHSEHEHYIGDTPTKPEGHVVVLNNRPTKIVDRAEFSRANFAKNAQ